MLVALLYITLLALHPLNRSTVEQLNEATRHSPVLIPPLRDEGSLATPDVRAVVRAVEARYRAATTLKATFLERYSQGRGDLRIESGTVYFSRPGRMRWEYETPEEKLFLVDGTNVWFYVPADRTATRARIKSAAADDWRTPLALLTGKAQLSRICGRIEFVYPEALGRRAPVGAGLPASPVESASGGNRSTGQGATSIPQPAGLRCLPRTPTRGSGDSLLVEEAPPVVSGPEPFQELLLEVDRAYRLVRLLIREAGGVETEFRFAGWQENLALPEVMFHFHSPPGVTIVEESTPSNHRLP